MNRPQPINPAPPASDGPPHVAGETELLCPACGYDLRGATGDRCTECGLAVDRVTLAESNLPWTQRKRIGYWRAYLRTVWMVFRRPTLVGREAAKPQNWVDAKHFRDLTTTLVFIALMVTATIVMIYASRSDSALASLSVLQDPFRFQGAPTQLSAFWADFLIVALAGWETWYGGPLLLLPLCFLWTGVAGYFFHPRSLSVERQNRAVAMSCYTAAPLVGVWLLLPLGLASAGLAIKTDKSPADYEWAAAALAIGLLGIAVFVATVGSWWVGTLKILKAATHASGARVAVVAVVLPVLWALAAVVCLYVLPSLVGFFVLVFASLR